MGLCLLGVPNHLKNLVWYGFVPLKKSKTKQKHGFGMALCLLGGGENHEQKPGVVWVCASWGRENHVKNLIWYGFVPLG